MSIRRMGFVVWWILGAGVAEAGEARTGDLLQLVLDLTRDEKLLLTLEAPGIGPCTVCLPTPLSSSSPAEVAHALMGGSCDTSALRVLVQDDYAHIVGRGAAGSLLDRTISLPPGRRSLVEFAAELRVELAATLTATDVPLLAVSAPDAGARNVFVDVEASDARTVRVILRGVTVEIPASSAAAHPLVTDRAKLVWFLTETSSGMGLAMRVINQSDESVERGEPWARVAPEPRPASREQWLRDLAAEESQRCPASNDPVIMAGWEADVAALTRAADAERHAAKAECE